MQTVDLRVATPSSARSRVAKCAMACDSYSEAGAATVTVIAGWGGSSGGQTRRVCAINNMYHGACV